MAGYCLQVLIKNMTKQYYDDIDRITMHPELVLPVFWVLYEQFHLTLETLPDFRGAVVAWISLCEQILASQPAVGIDKFLL